MFVEKVYHQERPKRRHPLKVLAPLLRLIYTFSSWRLCCSPLHSNDGLISLNVCKEKTVC